MRGYLKGQVQSIDWLNTTGSPVSSGDRIYLGPRPGDAAVDGAVYRGRAAFALADIGVNEVGAVAINGCFAYPKKTGAGTAMIAGHAVTIDLSSMDATGALDDPGDNDETLRGFGIVEDAASDSDEMVTLWIDYPGDYHFNES